MEVSAPGAFPLPFISALRTPHRLYQRQRLKFSRFDSPNFCKFLAARRRIRTREPRTDQGMFFAFFRAFAPRNQGCYPLKRRMNQLPIYRHQIGVRRSELHL
jgi:hypothetical protein